MFLHKQPTLRWLSVCLTPGERWNENDPTKSGHNGRNSIHVAIHTNIAEPQIGCSSNIVDGLHMHLSLTSILLWCTLWWWTSGQDECETQWGVILGLAVNTGTHQGSFHRARLGEISGTFNSLLSCRKTTSEACTFNQTMVDKMEAYASLSR